MNAFKFAPLFVAMVSLHAHAGLTITTGGKDGTYFNMCNSIANACGNVACGESGGSDDNLEALVNKKADLGFVQGDALQFGAMNDARLGDNDIKVLMVLHPEEVHLLVKTDVKVGKTLGLMGKAPQSIEDLKGSKVGAWGGSYTTARALNAQTNIGMEVVRMENAGAAMSALNSGDITAILAVGGQPLGFINNLKPVGAYRVLDIPQSVAARATFYVPAKLNYKGLAQGTPTVAAQALLVTRNFKTEGKKAELSALKACIVKNLDEFREGTGHHPKWDAVIKDAPSARSFYEVTQDPAPAPQLYAPKAKK